MSIFLWKLRVHVCTAIVMLTLFYKITMMAYFGKKMTIQQVKRGQFWTLWSPFANGHACPESCEHKNITKLYKSQFLLSGPVIRIEIQWYCTGCNYFTGLRLKVEKLTFSLKPPTRKILLFNFLIQGLRGKVTNLNFNLSPWNWLHPVTGSQSSN